MCVTQEIHGKTMVSIYYLFIIHYFNTQTVAPLPVTFQDGASQDVKAAGTEHSQVLPDTAWGYSAGHPYSVSGTVSHRGSGTPSNRRHFF